MNSERLAALPFDRRTWIVVIFVVQAYFFVQNLLLVERSLPSVLLMLTFSAGILAAWWVGRGPRRAWIAWLLFFMGGLAGLYLYWADLYRALWTFTQEFIQLWLNLVFERDIRNLVSFLSALMAVGSRAQALFLRWVLWWGAWMRNDPGSDPVVYAWMWTYLVWLLGCWAGWFTSRPRHYLLVFLPMLGLLAFLFDYYRLDVVSLWVQVLLAFWLVVLMHYNQLLGHWQAARVDYAENVSVNLLSLGFIAVGLVLLLALFTPSITRADLERWWRQWNEQSQTASRPQAGNGSSGRNGVTGIGQPESHALRGGITNSQQLAFTVKTGDLPPMPFASGSGPIPPHYHWRAYTYESYSNGVWFSDRTTRINYDANTIIYEASAWYRPLTHHFELANPKQRNLLFVSGELVGLDQPFFVNWRDVPRASPALPGADGDVSLAATEAASYTTQSLLLTVSEQTLRDAPLEFPLWVRRRYLKLPDTVPQRVRDLAREITASQTSLYGRAQAIEAYLRANYEYSLDVLPASDGEDPVDYFLFEQKKGYCDYYASSMVVMARAVGVPARLAVGYVGGTYDPTTATYIVREANAHAWVEVYIPSVGWVEFEPTSSQPAFARQSGDFRAASEPELEFAPAEEPLPVWLRIPRDWLYQNGGQAGAALVIVLFVGLLLRWAFSYISPESPLRRVDRCYRSLQRACKAWLPGVSDALTPSELDDLLRPRLANPTDLDMLLACYAQAVFSPHPITPAQARRAEAAWDRLQIRVWWLQATARNRKSWQGQTKANT